MFRTMFHIFNLTLFLCCSDVGQAGNCCGGEEKAPLINKKKTSINGNNKNKKSSKNDENFNKDVKNNIEKIEINKSDEVPHKEVEYGGLIIFAPIGYTESTDENNNKKISIKNLCDIVFIPNCISKKGVKISNNVRYLLETSETLETNTERLRVKIQRVRQDIVEKDSTETGQNFATLFEKTMTKIILDELSEIRLVRAEKTKTSIVLIKCEEKGIFLKVSGDKVQKNKKDKKNKKKRNSK